MLYLYNEYFSPLARFKRLLGKVSRGPDRLFQSLIRGLGELGVEYKVNPAFKGIIATACVLSGVTILKAAIKNKRKGIVKKIVAGPNLVITPNDAGGILKSPLIDTIVVPSQWVKDFYISLAPELSSKIFIWAAGVDLPEGWKSEVGNRRLEIDFLIFNKVKDQNLKNQIKTFLEQDVYRVADVKYGQYNQQQYFNLLERSKNLIYLSESESQGLAMFEAWAYNIPTLVWDRGYMEYGKHRFSGDTASPYLSAQTGIRFTDFKDFKDVLPKFLNASFFPRQWVEKNASNKLAAEKYLEIITL